MHRFGNKNDIINTCKLRMIILAYIFTASFDGNCSALVYGQPLNGNTTTMPGNNQTLDEKCFNSFMDLVTLTNIIDMTHTEKCR